MKHTKRLEAVRSSTAAIHAFTVVTIQMGQSGSSGFNSSSPEKFGLFLDTFVDVAITEGRYIRQPTPSLDPEPTHHPAAKRLVCIGDLHGDLDKTRRALQLGEQDSHFCAL